MQTHLQVDCYFLNVDTWVLHSLDVCGLGRLALPAGYWKWQREPTSRRVCRPYAVLPKATSQKSGQRDIRSEEFLENMKKTKTWGSEDHMNTHEQRTILASFCWMVSVLISIQRTNLEILLLCGVERVQSSATLLLVFKWVCLSLGEGEGRTLSLCRLPPAGPSEKWHRQVQDFLKSEG